ncbi:MAG TPA: alkaline phosphatase family protein [Thermoleophilaceae bacterium]|jgi:phospholipase C
MTRRTVLRTGAAAGISLAAARGLPAWARPVADLAKVRRPGSRPFPHRPEGVDSLPQVDHIIVLMMENHSFDNILGMLPHKVRSRRNVDGLPVSRRGTQLALNPDLQGHPVRAFHAPSECQLSDVPSQDWNASHLSYDNGRNKGFVKASGPVAMWFWDDTDLPFTYSLASNFPIGERYFQSCLAQTYPNRRYLISGTSSGITATDTRTFTVPAANGTIFDRLDSHKISWRSYYEDVPATVIVPGVSKPSRTHNFQKIDAFFSDCAHGKLPAVSYVDPQFEIHSEENPQDIQFGERFVARVVRAVLESPNWKNTAMFLTYDEHGGYYDHVAPPRAIKPDNIPPLLQPGEVPGSFNRYGFRVPLVAISPYARANYVSSVVQDHTSILKFIERKWNLGAMTFRDANAADMTDYFDFKAKKPPFLHPPRLAKAPDYRPGLDRCHALGMRPPGDPTPAT